MLAILDGYDTLLARDVTFTHQVSTFQGQVAMAANVFRNGQRATGDRQETPTAD